MVVRRTLAKVDKGLRRQIRLFNDRLGCAHAYGLARQWCRAVRTTDNEILLNRIAMRTAVRIAAGDITVRGSLLLPMSLLEAALGKLKLTVFSSFSDQKDLNISLHRVQLAVAKCDDLHILREGFAKHPFPQIKEAAEKRIAVLLAQDAAENPAMSPGSHGPCGVGGSGIT